MAQRDLPHGRKVLYYAGGGISLLGFLMFLSFFAFVAINIGRPNQGGANQQVPYVIGVTIGGFVLMIVGNALANIGKLGASGSGLLLDPQQARRDVEPWSRSTGGVLNDVLDEAVPNFSSPTVQQPLPFDEQIRRLDKMRQDGLLTDAEYTGAKQRILASLGSGPTGNS